MLTKDSIQATLDEQRTPQPQILNVFSPEHKILYINLSSETYLLHNGSIACFL